MKKPGTTTVAQGLAPYAMSGLLFALSWPNYPYVRLEIFAWVWMVPLLLALRSVTSFPRFLRNVYFTMFLGWFCGMSWLITSTPLGTVLGFLVGGAVFTVPLLGFYLVRRSLGWRAALWSAPVVGPHGSGYITNRRARLVGWGWV
jgi:apolipoprotein N-acyltransferase